MSMMPLPPLEPGVYTDITAYAAKNRIVFADKVRFREGFPETVGGCAKYNSLITFDGVGRALRQWARLDGTFTISGGSHKKVELLIATTKYDITPYDAIVTGSLSNPFTTASGDATVAVAHTAHDRAVGDVVMYPDGTTLDGIDFGKYAVEITNIVDPDNYEFEAYTDATGTTAGGGGTVTYYYDSKTMANNPITTSNGSATVVVTDAAHGLSTGATVTISGAANFNSVDADGTWPITRIDANSYSFTYTGAATGTGGGGGAVCRIKRCVNVGAASGSSMRLPCLQNWGEDLLFTLGKNSRVYLWSATLGPSVRARPVPRAPICDFIMVSPDDQSLVTFGTSTDNMLIEWCDEGDYTTWTPSALNTAGDKRLLRGSELVAAIPVLSGSLVFTDTAVHLMTFTGGDFVFSITYLGNTKIAGQNAVAEKDGIGYWMGKQNFYTYDGRIRTLPCTVRKWVFDDFNSTEARGCVAGINDAYGEVWFFYPSESATYNDSYATYAYGEAGTPWSIGDWERLAWMDSDIFDYPLALDASGNLFKHEFGTTNDGVALDAEFWTGDIQPDTSGEYVFLGKRLIPDANMTGNYYLTVASRDTQQDDYYVAGPVLMAESDKEAWLRWRGRRTSYRVATPTFTLETLATEDLLDLLTTEDGELLLADGVSQDQTLNLATTWRWGIPIVDIRQSGKRNDAT